MNTGSVLGYVGPGPGLTMFWAFLALLGTIGLAILYLLIWPFRMVLRKMRGETPPPSPAEPTQATSKGTDPATGPR